MAPSKDPLGDVCLWVRQGTWSVPTNIAEAREFAAAASRQGLVAWLGDSLAAEAPEWPDDLCRAVRRAHHVAIADGVRRLDLARRAQQRLETAGFRSLALKGAAVAETLYRSPAHRPMEDVDLFVLDRPGEARAALHADGFRETAAGDHAWVLEDPAGAGRLELHHSVTSCPGLFPVDVEALWERHQRSPSGVRIPSHEHLLVLLALHAAFQHGLVLSLAQYLDFRQLLAQPLDAERVARAAVDAGAEVALSMALAAAACTVAARCPSDLSRRLIPLGGRKWLQRKLAQPLALLTPAAPDLVRARWTVARGRRLALLALTLSPPSRPRLPLWKRTWWACRRAAALVRRLARA
jgi:hypothetical protein